MDFDNIIVSTEQLQNAVLDISEKVNRAYRRAEKLIAIVLLEGARPFANDLVMHLNVPVEIVYIKASSYNGGTESSGKVNIKSETELPNRLAGQDVLIIDDIYDTGLTLDTVTKFISECGPKSLRLCVLLEKKIKHKVELQIDFPGLKIEDLFVVGYGLDYNEKHRELPFIAEYPG